MRTECLICDGCGQHEQISNYDIHSAMLKGSDYLPEGWLMMRINKQMMAFHSIDCIQKNTKVEGGTVTFTDMTLFDAE